MIDSSDGPAHEHAMAMSRRTLFASAALTVSACASAPAGRAPAESVDENVHADIRAYADFGDKNAGGPGDAAAGAWIETRLARAGFSTERHAIRSIATEAQDPALELNGARVPVAAHTLGADANFASIRAPLHVWGAPLQGSHAAGAIVVVHLPSQRWSTAEHPAIRQTVEHAFAQRAAAVVLVTHGPTRELIKLNRRLDPAQQPGPVALLAPRDWAQLPAPAANSPHATLTLNAVERERAAFNVIGRIDRGAPSTIIISTPRSGWTSCAAERGPGIAVFLALAAQTPRRFRDHNLFFVCTSAHEFENSGNAALIEHLAPPPGHTALWLHLGAGFAARDWHEFGGQLLPLPSADPQRFLFASPHIVGPARVAFAGLPGLESPYSTEREAAGELLNIVAAGYPSVIGLFGAHRFHHVAQDDMRCIDPSHTAAVLNRIERLLHGVLAEPA